MAEMLVKDRLYRVESKIFIYLSPHGLYSALKIDYIGLKAFIVRPKQWIETAVKDRLYRVESVKKFIIYSE